MAKGKGWDLTSTHSLASAAEWLRKGSDAILVLVVRGQRGDEDNPLPPDMAFAVDARVSPVSAREMVESMLPEIEYQLDEQRTKAKAEARHARYQENVRAGGQT